MFCNAELSLRLAFLSAFERLQVRELVAAAGLDVAALKRVRVGGYRLPRELGIGQARARCPEFLTLNKPDDVPAARAGHRPGARPPPMIRKP